MQKIIKIFAGEIVVGKNNIVIQTGSVGSCVVVCLYDEESKIGGMVHATLPSKGEWAKKNKLNQSDLMDEKNSAGKYVDEGIDLLLQQIEKIGGKRENLKAKITGGAKMFDLAEDNKQPQSIGEKNVRAAKKELEILKIPIVGKDVGGNNGREVEFNLENKILNVMMKI